MEKYMDMDKHEIQAEINARKILLRQTQEQTIAHLECVVSSLLSKQTVQVRQEIIAEVASAEKLAPADAFIVKLQAENDNGVKSQRQKWRDEIAQLEAQIELAPEPAGSDEVW